MTVLENCGESRVPDGLIHSLTGYFELQEFSGVLLQLFTCFKDGRTMKIWNLQGSPIK